MCVKSLFVIQAVFVIMLSRSVMLERLPKCLDANNTVESCCPCFQESMNTCNQTCPDDYLIINKTAHSVNCVTKPRSTPVTTTTTMETTITTGVTLTPVTTITTGVSTENSVAMTTENATSSPFIEDKDEEANNFVICLKSCPEHQFYSNETKVCLMCDKKCLQCAWPDREHCIVCAYMYNETCFAQCPEGTEFKNKDNNGSKLCEKSEEKSLKLPYIIGGAAGGGVVVIIVIIVIVCCCCRRNKDQHDVGRRANGERRAMSVLLENQQSSDESRKEEVSRPSGRRPANYENTTQTLPSTREIQQQGDNVLRYTKDPTVKDKSTENLEIEAEESPYGNAAMIRLAQNVDVAGKKDDELKEMLDVEEMGLAPQAPVVPQPKPPLPVSKKMTKRTGIVKSLSQRMSKRLGKKKGKQLPEQPVHVPEDYVDMSGGPGAMAKNSGHATDDGGDGDGIDAKSLQDYENFSFDNIPQGRRAGKVITSPEDEMELYENTAGDQSDKGKGDNSDLEDYENTKELRKKPKESKKSAEDESGNMEDYENMTELELYENMLVKNK